jgi:hypothetical protein
MPAPDRGLLACELAVDPCSLRPEPENDAVARAGHSHAIAGVVDRDESVDDSRLGGRDTDHQSGGTQNNGAHEHARHLAAQAAGNN